MTQLKIDDRIDIIQSKIDIALENQNGPFNSKLIQLIMDYAMAIIQKSGQIEREYILESKHEVLKLAEKIKERFNTSNEVAATVITSLLSVGGGFAQGYGAFGNQTAQGLGQALNAMGQGGSGFASVSKNANESEKEMLRSEKEVARMALDQQNSKRRESDESIKSLERLQKDKDDQEHRAAETMVGR